MAAVVDLIRTLTGREVVLVPPTAYLTSAPAAAAHGPVELVVPRDLLGDDERDERGPLEIDVTRLLEGGVPARMLLGRCGSGGLELGPALDVAL